MSTLEQRLENAAELVGSPLSLAVDNSDSIRHNNEVIIQLEMDNARGALCPLHQAYGMITTEALDIRQRKRLAELYGMNASELKKAFDALERKQEIATQLGIVPDNEYAFIGALMKKWQATMTFQKIYRLQTPYVIKSDGAEDIVLAEEDLSQFAKDVQNYMRAADPKRIAFAEMIALVIKTNAEMKMGYNEQQLVRALEDWTRIEQNMIIASAQRLITFDAALVTRAEAEWDKLVAAITGVNVKETKGVLKHFIWQIKRKMAGLPVHEHMMPVLSGLQGIGKSTIVKLICAPIADFTVMTNFEDITDGRDHDLWKNFVLILDEMGNSTQSNIEVIKQKITGDTFNPRVMRTNNNTLIINKSTMIGTTNKDLSRLIFDDTGMRRFFQITCKTSFDRAVVNSVDYELIWKSIDESVDSIVMTDKALAASIAAIQNGKRYQSLLELFFIDREYSNFTETVQGDLLYKEFREYEEANQPKAEMSSQKFYRDMVDIPSRISWLEINEIARNKKGKRFEITKLKEGV